MGSPQALLAAAQEQTERLNRTVTTLEQRQRPVLASPSPMEIARSQESVVQHVAQPRSSPARSNRSNTSYTSMRSRDDTAALPRAPPAADSSPPHEVFATVARETGDGSSGQPSPRSPARTPRSAAAPVRTCPVLLGWISWLSNCEVIWCLQVDVLFDTLDANGDGLITREEMRGALAPQAQAKAQTQARAVSPSVGRCATLSLFDLGFD